jgi:hypothetical protein
VAVWLIAHTNGPASATPLAASTHFGPIGCPAEITPQANAHIGANQVIGFSSSNTVAATEREAGADMAAVAADIAIRPPHRSDHRGRTAVA